ncbi:MAG: hypothetical protein FWF95_04875 [Syntrophorhabdaceae bacterium]|nr:hypothetical protein [Syntrophorhabdaceae bacterium]
MIDGGKRGIDNILAGISSRNIGSLAFHVCMGFTKRGRIAGDKTRFGQEFDVVSMQRRLPRK